MYVPLCVCVCVPHQVDVSSLATLCEDNYQHPAIRLIGEAEGRLAEGGSAAIAWQFTPVEAKVWARHTHTHTHAHIIFHLSMYSHVLAWRRKAIKCTGP